jgi:hypothetical protein
MKDVDVNFDEVMYRDISIMSMHGEWVMFRSVYKQHSWWRKSPNCNIFFLFFFFFFLKKK